MYRKLFINLISILSLGLALALVTASCTQDEKGTPIKKGVGGGGGSNKPEEQAIQAALAAKVLLLIEKTSELQAAQAGALSLSLKLNVNAKNPVSWKKALSIRIGETINSIAYPEEAWELENNLKLSMSAKRIEKTKKADDFGYLALTLQLKRVEEENQKTQVSYMVVLIDLNKAKNPQAFRKAEVIFPVDKFSLDEWIAKHTKAP